MREHPNAVSPFHQLNHAPTAAKGAGNERSDVLDFSRVMAALGALRVVYLSLKGGRYLFTRGL